MDKTVATLIGVVSVVIGFHATRAMHESKITGQVNSARDSIWVFAVNGKDSLKTMVNNGKFRFKVKPGAWKVTVGRDQLKDAEGKMVEVVEGSTLDMGTIILN
ncbi:hypothetical protein [Longitalea arenae]|uniref:hypothetical protein n=1 Tax=Longitalea arenae TaxID=2812558 RepID=UPI001967E09C|nr:hypothetical protein [Longitalea arenae]